MMEQTQETVTAGEFFKKMDALKKLAGEPKILSFEEVKKFVSTLKNLDERVKNAIEQMSSISRFYAIGLEKGPKTLVCVDLSNGRIIEIKTNEKGEIKNVHRVTAIAEISKVRLHPIEQEILKKVLDQITPEFVKDSETFGLLRQRQPVFIAPSKLVWEELLGMDSKIGGLHQPMLGGLIFINYEAVGRKVGDELLKKYSKEYPKEKLDKIIRILNLSNYLISNGKHPLDEIKTIDPSMAEKVEKIWHGQMYEVLMHEYLHHISSIGKDIITEILKRVEVMLNEGLTQYFTRSIAIESNGHCYNSGYDYLTTACFLLAKAAGHETLWKAYLKWDFKELKESLEKIKPGLYKEIRRAFRSEDDLKAAKKVYEALLGAGLPAEEWLSEAAKFIKGK